MTLRTGRLLLRPWRDADFAPFAALNADPEVRRWFEGTLSGAESDAQAVRHQAHIDMHGFGLWAAEVPGVAPFLGFIGLRYVEYETPQTPTVEAGWRLARAHWGRGYATEGARAVLAHGFRALGLAEIVAFSVPGNLASRRAIEKAGMAHDPAGDFDYPGVAIGHPFRRCVTYRAGRPL